MGTKNGSKLGGNKIGNTELLHSTKLKTNTHTSEIKRESYFKQGDTITKNDTHMRGIYRDEMTRDGAKPVRNKEMSQDLRLDQGSSAI